MIWTLLGSGDPNDGNENSTPLTEPRVRIFVGFRGKGLCRSSERSGTRCQVISDLAISDLAPRRYVEVQSEGLQASNAAYLR